MKTSKKLLKFIFWFLSILYFAVLCLLWVAPHWPRDFWWLANFFQIVPLWLLAVPLGFLILMSSLFRHKSLWVIHGLSCLILFVGIMGFEFPSRSQELKNAQYVTLRVATVNLGTTVDLEKLTAFISRTKPDIMAFQEVYSHHQKLLKNFFPKEEWDLFFQGQLGLASRLRILDSELVDRRALGEWGGVVAKFVLQGSTGPLYLYNVWLESPREGVEAVMYRRWEGIQDMKRVTDVQVAESHGVSDWTGGNSPVLVMGDFNQLISSPIYREYWSHFNNAFSEIGFGFGYTKYTSWHGVRIDHLLYDSRWVPMKSLVGPDLGADHRPLITDMALLDGQFFNFISQSKEENIKKSIQQYNILFFEDFEFSPGKFEESSEAELNIDYNKGYLRSNSLRVLSNIHLKQLSARVTMDVWRLDDYPMMKFAYMIPPQTPVVIEVKTHFDDWVCLGGTPSSQCPHSQIKDAYILTDDGQWHEIEIDAKSSVQSLLPAMTLLKAFQFHIPQNRYVQDHFWIDDFMIYHL